MVEPLTVYMVRSRQTASFERKANGPMKVVGIYRRREDAAAHCAALQGMPIRHTGHRREFSVKEVVVREAYLPTRVASLDEDSD